MSLPKWLPGGHFGFFGSCTLPLVWLWMSTPKFSRTILVYLGRSLLIFIDVIFKMAAWWPYWIFRFLDSVRSMVSGVCFGFSVSNFMCMLFVAMGRSLLISSNVTFKMGAWQPYWIFSFLDCNLSLALISIPKFSSLLILSNVTFKMAP